MISRSVFVVDVEDHEDDGEWLEHLQKVHSEGLADYLEEDCHQDVEVEEGVGFETPPPVLTFVQLLLVNHLYFKYYNFLDQVNLARCFHCFRFLFQGFATFFELDLVSFLFFKLHRIDFSHTT